MFLWLIPVVGILWFWYSRRNLYRLAAKLPLYRRSWPILGITHKLLGDTESLMSTMQEFSYESMKYDGIVGGWLIHKYYIVAANPMDVEYIVKTCLEKDDLVTFVRKLIGNGSIFAPVSIWRQRRRALTPIFSPRIIDNFVDVFAEQSQKLVAKLSSTNGEKFDLWPFMNRLTMDTVSETVLGVKVNAQDDPDSPYLNAVTSFLAMTMERMANLWLQPDWLFRLFPQYNDYVKKRNFIQSFADKVIKSNLEKYKNNKISKTKVDHDSPAYKNMSMLDHLIQSPEGYTEVELREETLTVGIAGTDTSAIATSYTLMLMAKYPEIQEKVYEELYNVFGDSDRLLVKEDLPKLQYLEQVMKEVLRIFPVAPFIIRKIEKDTKLPSGRVLPAGSAVICSIWGLHRDPKYWGSDAEEFNPDRFLPDRFNLKYPGSFIPFSYGQRNCIGYQFAMKFIKTALSTILRAYKIVEDRENGPVPKIRQKFELASRAVEGYNVALEKRKKVPT